jgi:hypothetical protein
MTAHRGSDDGAFSWPPTDADLAVIDVVSATTRPAPASVRPVRDARTRPPGFRRADGLLLLAAGMLFGSAVPSLDTAPPTRIGVHAAERSDALAAANPAAPAPSAPAPMAAVDVPVRDARSVVSNLVSSAAAAPVASATRSSRTDPRTRQVLAVLQTYGRAWSRMDAQAARAAMPSADVDALTRTFTALREQKLTLSGCQVAGSGATATASCTATRRYRPRQGDHSTRVERGRWYFRVVRTPQRWVIADVDRG